MGGVSFKLARWCLLATWGALTACSDSVFPGEQEEVPTDLDEVPAQVQVAAERWCHQMGGERCEQWSWDKETGDWECQVIGLDRVAELDVAEDGGFLELEQAYDIAEVEAALPEVARWMQTRCRQDPGMRVELSFRREELLDEMPDLKTAWSRSGVVLEFQCPNGRDFEIDPQQNFVTRPEDDQPDRSSGE